MHPAPRPHPSHMATVLTRSADASRWRGRLHSGHVALLPSLLIHPFKQPMQNVSAKELAPRGGWDMQTKNAPQPASQLDTHVGTALSSVQQMSLCRSSSRMLPCPRFGWLVVASSPYSRLGRSNSR